MNTLQTTKHTLSKIHYITRSARVKDFKIRNILPVAAARKELPKLLPSLIPVLLIFETFFVKHHSVLHIVMNRLKKFYRRVLSCFVYKRNANLKELLAPSNPYKPNKLEGEGCYKCAKRCDAKRCDSCKNFFTFGNSFRDFRAAATGRIFLILKSLTYTSSNVVYLAECVLCGLEGVCSTANFKSRLANYKSHIKHKRRTCSVTNHFIDVHEADHSSLKFMLIDQHHSEVLKSEKFWIGMLLTNRKGLNGSHDFAQQ